MATRRVHLELDKNELTPFIKAGEKALEIMQETLEKYHGRRDQKGVESRLAMHFLTAWTKGFAEEREMQTDPQMVALAAISGLGNLMANMIENLANPGNRDGALKALIGEVEAQAREALRVAHDKNSLCEGVLVTFGDKASADLDFKEMFGEGSYEILN